MKLTDQVVLQKLTELNMLTESPWQVKDDQLVKTFRFDSFLDAMAFMARVTPDIETQDHHPSWSNIYNRVSIALTTHEFNGISQRDFDLAKAIEAHL